MQEQFYGHYPPTEDELEALWETCFFSCDSSSLLDLYRFKPETQKAWLDILKSDKLKDRLWIPHQVGFEFCNNRLSVIQSERQKYTTNANTFSKLAQPFEDKRKHPFLKEETRKAINDLQATVLTELDATKRLLVYQAGQDPILREVFALFKGKVGAPYPPERLDEIFTEGEARYAIDQPPGFADKAQKDKGPNATLAERISLYGDLIVWFPLIEKVKAEGKPVIFITSERKRDWWLLYENDKDKVVSARPELIAEMQAKAQQRIALYQLADFMAEVGRLGLPPVSTEAIEEVRAVERGKGTEEALAEEVPVQVYWFIKALAKTEVFRTDLDRALGTSNHREVYQVLSRFSKQFREISGKLARYDVPGANGLLMLAERAGNVSQNVEWDVLSHMARPWPKELRTELDFIGDAMLRLHPEWATFMPQIRLSPPPESALRQQYFWDYQKALTDLSREVSGLKLARADESALINVLEKHTGNIRGYIMRLQGFGGKDWDAKMKVLNSFPSVALLAEATSSNAYDVAEKLIRNLQD